MNRILKPGRWMMVCLSIYFLYAFSHVRVVQATWQLLGYLNFNALVLALCNGAGLLLPFLALLHLVRRNFIVAAGVLELVFAWIICGSLMGIYHQLLNMKSNVGGVAVFAAYLLLMSLLPAMAAAHLYFLNIARRQNQSSSCT